MVAPRPRIRKLFHAGRIAPLRPCNEQHRGPLRPNLRCAGWLGHDWADCTACGSTITVSKREEAA